MKRAVKKAIANSANAFKHALGFGDNKPENADHQAIQDDDSEEAALRYLYGDDFDDGMSSSACQEVKLKETDPVKLAILEIQQVEDSLAILVGRIQSPPNTDNPSEGNAIREELNQLLFRLDDVKTLGDANLKEMRTQSLKQVKDALEHLCVGIANEDKSLGSISVRSSMKDLSMLFETVDHDPIGVDEMEQKVNGNTSQAASINDLSQPDGAGETNGIAMTLNNTTIILNGSDNPAITLNCSPQIDNSNNNEEKNDETSDDTILNGSDVPITSTSASQIGDPEEKTDETIPLNIETIDKKDFVIVENLHWLNSNQTDTDMQVPCQEIKIKTEPVNSTEVEEKLIVSDLTTTKNVSTNHNAAIIADEEASTLHDIVQQYEVLSPVEISNETHSSGNFVLPSGDSNVNQQETPVVIDSCSVVDMTEETISIEDMDTTPPADFDLQQHPVQLLDQDYEGRFTLNERALMQILGHESIKNRKLAIISVVGAFRRGKSFLLNFILRYLQADGARNWLVRDNGNELKGFSWQGGMDRDTTGILMWSKPFLIGDDRAVVLVDTQGTFDCETSMKNSSFIFTLSTLMSSVQIFNISERIQMDDLTNLQHFLEFGHMVNNSCKSKVFEKFIFLIRDWKFFKTMNFGFHGGNILLAKWFENQASSEQAEMIKTCFEKVECFLMPHPGEKVSCDDCFRGDLDDIRPEFLTHLKTFVESIIEDICVKKIGESFLLAGDFVAYLKTFIERLQDPKLEPKSLMTALSDIMFEKARKEAEFFYTQEMESQLRVCGNLAELHNTTLNKALEIFDKVYPFGGTEIANAKRYTVKEVLIERSKPLLHQKVEEETSFAFSFYHTCLTTFCNDINTGGHDFNLTLNDVHENACKKANEMLRSRLAPLIDDRQFIKELTLLHKRANDLHATLEPIYERNVRKEEMNRAIREEERNIQQILQHQVQVMQLRSTLTDVLGRVTKQYRQAMEHHCMYSNLTSQQLQEKHKQEQKHALTAFEPLLNLHSLNDCKRYIDQAKADIRDFYTQLLNHEKKKRKDALTEAYTTAVCKYHERMDSLKLDEQPVLDLFTYHETALCEAMAHFQSLNDGSDIYASSLSNLTKEIDEKFKLYHRMNEKTKKLVEDKELLKLNSEMKNAALDYQNEIIKRCNTTNSHLEIFKQHIDIREKCIANFQLAVAECNPDKTAATLVELNEEIDFLYNNIGESEARKLSLLREKECKRTGKKNYPIGIDLGTTNCCVAVYEEGRVKIMVNNIGKTTTPSTVYFEKDGHTFGESAIVRGFADPRNCISEMKRIIGRKFDDSIVQSLKERSSFQVKNSDGVPVIEVTKGIQPKLLPEEISGLVLGEMKRLASVYLDSEVFDAVVTIPAYFNETQREATKRACNLAGINVLRIINEPTAAAIAYGLQTNVERLRTVLVFDFGGGTCDVSILEMERGRYTVKASQGDNQLGGEDFDDNLTRHVAELYKQKTKITLENTDLRRLRHQCERAKRDLTDYAECEVHVEMIGEGAADLREKITREQFDEINKDLYPRVLEPVKGCLKSAGMQAKNIDDVVLVGGSSRMKKIQDLLKDFFPDKEIIIRINPDEAIAYGAAIQAALSSGLYGDKLHIIDITPMSLGIGCRGNIYSIITPRNTELPSKCCLRYATSCDYQEAMSIRVYQGEHTEDEFLNTKIGEFSLYDLTKAPQGETQVDVTFEIDEDGILEVTAWEVSKRDNSKSVRITKCVK